MNNAALKQQPEIIDAEVEHPVSVPAPTGRVVPMTTAVSPYALLETAVSNGAGLDVIEKLMALQERHDAGQARKAFDAAMAEARADMPVIVKNQAADFGAGKTAYKYEDLAAIAEAVGPVLARHGLSYRFRTGDTGQQITVTCIVAHRDGYSEETSLSAPRDTSGSKNAIQAIGSAVTYLQRYTLKAALGLAASKDDDGHGYSNGRTADKAAIELISDQQAETLRDLIATTGTNIDSFLKYFKAECIPDIPAKSYQAAFDNLQRRVKLQEQKTAPTSSNDFPGDRK